MPNIFSLQFLTGVLYSLPGIVIALSFHEFAHAFAAHLLGDDTARNLGRMTLNPMAHLDPVGFVALIFVGFGWAKPVPVNPRNYRGNVRVADIIVSLAGITMNFLLAILFMLLVMSVNFWVGYSNEIFNDVLLHVIIINISLMLFNLIPVPPLDGSHVVESLLMKKIGPAPFMFLRRYSMIILVAVLLILQITDVLSSVVGFLYNGLFDLLLPIFV